jgi:hypothetical protein
MHRKYIPLHENPHMYNLVLACILIARRLHCLPTHTAAAEPVSPPPDAPHLSTLALLLSRTQRGCPLAPPHRIEMYLCPNSALSHAQCSQLSRADMASPYAYFAGLTSTGSCIGGPGGVQYDTT